MRFYGKAEGAAKAIIDAFQAERIPEAVATVFIKRSDNVPASRWSWNNQILAALHGHRDARGFRQWQEVGRSVKKGEKAFHILVPMTKKREVTDEDTGETREVPVVIGFKSAAVFGKDQTEGDPLPDDVAEQQFLESLPLVDVARRWGLNLGTFDGRGARYRGKYAWNPSSGERGIALGVENLSTWTHELVHAAEDRLGNLTKGGQDPAQEIVAELGGAVLLELLGYEQEADRGGCYGYVKAYAEKADKPVGSACMKVVDRVCAAVALILEEAEKAEAQPTEAAEAVAA